MTLQTEAFETVALSSALTIRTVQSIRDLLLAGLSSAGALVVDIPQDAECDLSFVQLMESARVFAHTHDKIITLRNPASNGLLSILERGGFTTEMDPSDRFFWFHERQMQ